MLSSNELWKIIKSSANSANEYFDIFLESSIRTLINFDDNKVESISTGIDSGVGIRLISNDLNIFFHSNDTNFNNIVSLCKEIRTASEVTMQNPISDDLNKLELLPEKIISPVIKNPANLFSHLEKIKIIEACNKAARGYSDEIKQVSVAYFDTTKKTNFVNTEGTSVEQDKYYIRMVVQAVAQRGDILQTAFEAPGLQCGFDFFNKNKPEELGRMVALRAVKMLDSVPSPSGPMQVVLASGSGGVIFHEAVGHGLEADEVEKGSVFRNKLGQKVASSCVTLIDNPTIAELWGSYEYDDEGSPSKETVLIENGVLKNYICDKYYGEKIGLKSSGNGRRENYLYAPIPRMSNTYLKPGSTYPNEIIKSTKSGLYAKKLGGGQVDPQSGDFVFSIAEGYLIKNGKICEPVRGATLIGNGPKILNLIDMVADDLEFDAGTCGKDGQGAPVTTGQPTIRIKEITVGGVQ